MRKVGIKTVKELSRKFKFLIAIGFVLGGVQVGQFTSSPAYAAEIRDGVRTPAYEELVTPDRQELADMRGAEEWEEPWVNPFSPEEMDLFAALLWSEGGDQPLPDGLCYICDVVLNRIDSSRWPNDLRSVIYQPGQFSVVSNGSLDRAYGNAPQVCYDAIISQLQNRWNYDIQFFSMGYNANGTVIFTHGTHFYSA